MAFAYDLSSSTLQVLDDRTRLKDSLQNRVSRISVEAAYGMPRLCEIEATPPFPVGAVGDVISIFAYAPGNLTGDILFRGIVKSREIRMDAAFGSRYVIRAYDGAYDMTAQKKTRGFKDMTYGEVAKQIAKSHGLDPLFGSKILTNGAKHKFIVQANETDWDFINRLARELGFVTYVKVWTLLTRGMTALYFGPVEMAERASPNTAFEVGDNRVLAYRGLLTTSGMAGAAVVPGWDEAKGATASGQTSLSSKMRRTMKDTSSAGQFKKSTKAGPKLSLETFAGTKARADRAAMGAAVREAGASVDLDMRVKGNPLIDINKPIKVYDDVYGPLKGIHIVSSVLHVFEPGLDGYTTTIYCTGLEDRSMSGLQGGGVPPQRFHGIYPAIVNDIADPEKKGRVNLTLPWLDRAFVTGWARVLQLGAGAGTGLQLMPRPKDEVIVAFENGQLDLPYVLGGVYGKGVGKIPHAEMVVDGAPMKTALTTKAGHQIILDDTKDKSTITIHTTNGNSCSIVMDAKAGITISTKGDRPVTINSSADVNVTAKKNAKVTGNDVTVEAKGKATVNANSSVTVSGGSVTVDASSALKLKGAVVNVEASGILTLKGSVVKIN